MGNKTSSSSFPTNDSQYSGRTSGKAKPGALDAETQLEALYTDAINSMEVKEAMKTLFQNVRILVVGRSGCGKSTLIRLMVGDKGPRSICRGEAGEQNIADEWRYPDPDLPLIFHDSNGIDVRCPATRLNDIRKFLDTHQESKDFKQHINLVWYVFSACDTRFLDDGGLLEILMEYKIPLLLIMTFNDHPISVTQNVEGEPLKKLMGRIVDSRRKDIRKHMIRLGNYVKVQPDGSLQVVQKDSKGLKKVTSKTKNMIHEKLRSTWIACQVVDANEKLEMSARLIVERKRQETFMACLVCFVPVVQEAQLGYMFFAVIRSLAKIWGVPEQMEKALMAEFFVEGGNNLLRNLFKSVLLSLGLAASIASTIITGGVASFSIFGVFLASGVTQMRTCTKLLMTFSLLILGAILYTKISIQTHNDDWDKSLDKNKYKKYAHDFASSKDAEDIKTFIFLYESLWEGTVSIDNQTEKLKKQLITFLQNLMMKRKNSLSSCMAQEDEKDAQNQHMPMSDVNDYHGGGGDVDGDDRDVYAE